MGRVSRRWILLAWLGSAPALAQGSSTPARFFWVRGDAAWLGLDVPVLERHRQLCQRTAADACLVAYRGRIVQEWYGPRYARPMYAMSSTKCVTGLLVGMLIADGKISIPYLESGTARAKAARSPIA
jgi:CubicO group peptidase (beta-lactamase class C family)